MDIILQQFFSFTSFIEALKKIERYRNQFYWKDYPKLKRYESVADHSWRVSVLVLLVKDRLSQKMDLEKALKMAIIHDIAETVVGDSHPMGNDGTGKDTYYNNKDLAQKKYEKEKKGAEKLFSKLPEKEQNYCFNLWLEYEKRDCFESKVVKALDAIECALQVLEYRKGHMFAEHLNFTIGYAKKYSNIDPFLSSFADTVVQELKKRYKEFKK